MSSNVTKIAAGAAAVVAIGIGAAAVGSASSSNDSQAGNRFAGPPGVGQQAAGPQGGFGTPVTGTTAKKVEAAALAKYPGSIEQIMKLQDGTYVAHVITSNGEVHVLVDADFNVKGVDQGGPPQGGTPPGAGAAPPSGGSGETS